VFGPLPVERPPDRGFEHVIELEEESKPMSTTPYMHLKKFKDEIKKAIKDFLKMGHIRPFTSFVVLEKKKDVMMRMCIDYKVLKKKTIKNRYMIPRIYESIYELHA
jgi:hypothetical protein